MISWLTTPDTFKSTSIRISIKVKLLGGRQSGLKLS